MPSINGLISGLDTTGLIKDLLQFQQQPIDQLKARIKTETDKRTALLAFTAKVVGLETKASALSTAASLATPAVASSDETILEASAGENLPAGSYSFRVKDLASAAQFTSNGFSSEDDKIGAGTLIVNGARGSIDRPTDLDLLNGGAGVRRGSIRITNRAGATAVVDLSTALTVNDVLDAIRSASGLSVNARVAAAGEVGAGESLVLEDSSGGTGNLRVEDVSGGHTAQDLGILGSAASSTLRGSSVLLLGRSLPLAVLNDGLGVRLGTGADLQVTQSNGAVFTVDLGSASTLGGVMDAINSAAGNTGVTVSISGRKLVATDSSGGAGAFSIADFGSARAATDLGLTAAASGATITGRPLLAGIDAVLLSSLRGGAGIPAGSLALTNRAGASAVVDLSGATTTQDVIDLIGASGLSITASLNEAGNGLQLNDASGGSGPLKVEEVGGGSTAAALGIFTAGVSASDLTGADLGVKWVGEATLLKSLNGGSGVAAGSIRITDPSGRFFKVNLSHDTTVGDVLLDINGAASAAGSDVRASVNDTGNGIRLAAASGAGTLQVAEVDAGTTAHDLNILGSAKTGTPLEINGSFERTIDISADDTLRTVADRINAMGMGVTASVLDDGSSIAPKRLHLVSNQPGVSGSLILGTSGTSLNLSRTAEGRDAVLFYGGSGGRPVVIRSPSNQFTEVVKGLSVTAKSVSDAPVVVTATRDLGKVKDAINELVTAYNDVVGNIQDLTHFDPATGDQGPLLGESALRTVERQISDAILRPVLGLPSGANLASQLGLRVTADGKLTFNEGDFDTMAAKNSDTVKDIFTRSRPLDDTVRLADFANGGGVSTAAGGAELKIWKRDGTSFDVDLTGALTVRDLLSAINHATGNGGAVTASISTSGRSIVLTDSTSGTTAFRVEPLNGSGAYQQIGLDGATDTTGGGTITGREIDLKDDPGVSRRLFDVVTTLSDAQNGVLQTRADAFQTEIDDFNKRITSMQDSITAHEQQLRQKFAQLEILMGQNQNTLQQLAAGLGGVTGRLRQRREGEMKDPGKAQSYLEVQVKTASPDQLLLMLLDGAVRFVEGALERMEKGDREGKGALLARAGDIVLELVQSLNPAIGEKLYENLVGLYKFIYLRLADGNVRDDRSSVEEGLKILRHVRETWREAVASWRAESQAAAAAATAAVTAASSPPLGISLQA